MKTTDRQPMHRSRRLRRRAALLLLTACAATGWWRYLNYVPDITIPTPTLPSPNAFDLYVQAGNSIVNSDAVADAIMSADSLRKEKKTPLTPAQKEGLLAANAPALETMRRGFQYPYLHPPVRSLYTPLPHIAKFRATARLLFLEGQVREARGDIGGAANSSLDAMQLGADVPHGGPLVAYLGGVACEAIGRRPLWSLTDRMSADEARMATRRMEQITARRIPLSETLTEEKWGLLASLHAMLRRYNSVQILRQLTVIAYPAIDGEEESDMPPGITAIQTAWMLTNPKRRILDNLTDYMDAQAARAPEPYATRRAAPELPIDMISRIMLPPLEGTFAKEADVQAQNGLLTLVLALRAFRDERGDHPQSLEALAASGYLTKIPEDPFSKTLAPPVYRRISAEKYLLYSVGPDATDDGGKPIIDTKRGTGKPQRWAEDGDKGDFIVGVNLY